MKVGQRVVHEVGVVVHAARPALRPVLANEIDVLE